MINRLLKLYPRAWRERYEDELGALLADRPVTPGLVADLLRGILDAHLHPRLVARSFAGTARSLPVPIVPVVALAVVFVLLALSLRPLGAASPFAPATRAPGVALSGRVIEFVSYDDPTYGYRLAVPKDARRELSNDGQGMTFTYRDGQQTPGTFAIQVTVVRVESGTTPDQLLLAHVVARDTSQPRQLTANGDRIVGAGVSYAVDGTASCPERRAVAAAFVSGFDGYIVRIDSDAAGRCDAELVPQTRPVIESLRLR